MRWSWANGNTESCGKHDMECTTLLACELPLPLRHTGLLPSLQQAAELLQLREQSLREGWGRVSLCPFPLDVTVGTLGGVDEQHQRCPDRCPGGRDSRHWPPYARRAAVQPAPVPGGGARRPCVRGRCRRPTLQASNTAPQSLPTCLPSWPPYGRLRCSRMRVRSVGRSPADA